MTPPHRKPRNAAPAEDAQVFQVGQWQPRVGERAILERPITGGGSLFHPVEVVHVEIGMVTVKDNLGQRFGVGFGWLRRDPNQARGRIR